MKKFLTAMLLAALSLTTVEAHAGRSLMKQLAFTVDLSGTNIVPYTEQYVLNTKAGQAFYIMVRVEVTGAAGATNGFVVQAIPSWDKNSGITSLPINMIASNSASATDSVKTTTDIDNLYVMFWGEAAFDLPEGAYPPYLSFQVREDMTAGTANVYIYMVAR